MAGGPRKLPKWQASKNCAKQSIFEHIFFI